MKSSIALKIKNNLIIALLLICFASCNQSSKTPKTEENTRTEIQDSVTTDDKGKTFGIKFNPGLTFEEWINSIWIDVYGDSPDEVLGIIELNPDEIDEFNLFFAVKFEAKTGYYYLQKDKGETYSLKQIATSGNSWVNSYGKSPHCTVSIYDLTVQDVDYNGTTEILLSAEIIGMTEAEDGMKPFQKVQHDIISILDKGLKHNEKLTNDFNKKYGVVINEDTALNTHDFLSQKYYAPISNEFAPEKIEMLLTDINAFTIDTDDKQNVFSPVKKLENNEFVIDLGYNYYEGYFIPYENNLELDQLYATDYPVFYVEDHGIYVYSITNIKVDDDILLFTLEKKYFQDENTQEIDRETAEPIDVILQYINEAWVLTYQSNPLMMEKNKSELQTINSNQGQ